MAAVDEGEVYFDDLLAGGENAADGHENSVGSDDDPVDDDASQFSTNTIASADLRDIYGNLEPRDGGNGPGEASHDGADLTAVETVTQPESTQNTEATASARLAETMPYTTAPAPSANPEDNEDTDPSVKPDSEMEWDRHCMDTHGLHPAHPSIRSAEIIRTVWKLFEAWVNQNIKM